MTVGPDARTCNGCGGRVDVIPVPRTPGAQGPATHVGACERCGDWFDEDELSELPRRVESGSENNLHY
jgi:hypothetical protein